MIRKRLRTIFASEIFCLHKIYTIIPYNIMRKVILLTAMPKEGVCSSSIYVNGGSKVTFCVKHNLISTFFNFVFYCTLVFIMCFLTAGNICAQGTLSLLGEEHGGYNCSISGSKVLFKDDGTLDVNNQTTGDYIGCSCVRVGGVGGAELATSFTPGEIHTFTVTLNPYSGTLDGYPEPFNHKDVVRELHIAALNCVIPENDKYKEYTSNIVAEESIELSKDPTKSLVLTLEVNQPYAAVYLYKKNRDNDWEYVDIASVTRTVETPVVISEEVDNSITAQTGATVNLTRTLVAGTWNTICLPFVPTEDQAKIIFGTTAKFAEFSSVSNGVMQFTSVDVKNLHAGTPYLVLPSQDKTTVSPIKLTGVNIEATEPGEVTYGDYTGDYTFKGIYILKSFVKDDHTIRFVATGNKLKYPNTINPLKALRAYFTVPVSGGSGAQTQNAKDYTFAVDSFVPTSIANIQIEGDGDGAIYNIGGQRVEGKSLPKGIYIREGKKFVVK